MSYNEGLASLASRAKWARGFLWAFIAISALGTVVDLARDYAYYETDIPTVTLTVVAFVRVLFGLAAFLGCAVTIALWTYRAWANLALLRLPGLRRSASWAAASPFVPVAGLFVPFLAMRELFNRSHGEDADRANDSAADVTSWWTCYVAGWFLQLFVSAVAIFNRNGIVFIVTPQVMNYALAIFANLLLMGAAWFLIRTMRDITAAQSSSAGISETFA